MTQVAIRIMAVAIVLAAAPEVRAQGSSIVIDGNSISIQSGAAGGAADSIVIDGKKIEGGAAGAGTAAQGVSIVNGDVFIDGEPVPSDVTEFTGRSGQTYIIERRGSSVSVRSK